MTFLEAILIALLIVDKLRGLVMTQIGTPLKIPDLHLHPEQERAIQLSDNMQQVLSTLTGFVHNQRVLLRCTPNGVLETTYPRLKSVVHFTGSGANDTQQGSDIPCSELICMGHPDNTDKVWVTVFNTATVNNAWPLGKGETISFSVDNLRDLQMLIVADGEKLIVAYG